jgi:HSP20 family protein
MSWDDPFRNLRAWQERLSGHRGDSWSPPIDVYETATAYIIAAEVPGLTREEIELAVEDSRLTIRGRRAGDHAKGGDIVHYHQVERGHGPFARTFELSQRIHVEGVTADLAHGVLTIVLPKAPESAPRRIEVT